MVGNDQCCINILLLEIASHIPPPLGGLTSCATPRIVYLVWTIVKSNISVIPFMKQSVKIIKLIEISVQFIVCPGKKRFEQCTEGCACQECLSINVLYYKCLINSASYYLHIQVQLKSMIFKLKNLIIMAL
jgi:hypothetical protein